MGKRKVELIPGCVIVAKKENKEKYFLYLGTRDNVCYPTVRSNLKYQIFLPLNFRDAKDITEDKIVGKVKSFKDKGKMSKVDTLPNGYAMDSILLEPTTRLQQQVGIIRDFIDETI